MSKGEFSLTVFIAIVAIIAIIFAVCYRQLSTGIERKHLSLSDEIRMLRYRIDELHHDVNAARCAGCDGAEFNYEYIIRGDGDQVLGSCDTGPFKVRKFCERDGKAALDVCTCKEVEQ